MSGPYSGLDLSDLKQIMHSADSGEIRRTADGFKSISGSLDQVITTLQNSQTQLQSSWQGTASDAASQTFQNVIDQAQQTKQVSDQMAEHLPTLASQVESAQTQISNISEPSKPSGVVADVKGWFGDDDGYSAAKQAAANKAIAVLNDTDNQYQQSANYMNSLSGGQYSDGFQPTGGSTASANGSFDLGGSNGAMTGYGAYSSGYDGGGADGYDESGEDTADPYRTGLTSTHGDGIYGGTVSTPPTGGSSTLADYRSGPVTVDPGVPPPPVTPAGGGNPMPDPTMPFVTPYQNSTLGGADAPLRGPGSRSGLPGDNEESRLGLSDDDGILGSPASKVTRNGFRSSSEPESGVFSEENSGLGPGGTPVGETGTRPMGMNGMNGMGAGEGRGDRAGYLSEDEDYWTGGMPRSAAGDDGIFGGTPMSMTPMQERDTAIRSVYSSEEEATWTGGRSASPSGVVNGAEAESEGTPMMRMGGINGSGSSEEERRERPGYLRQERDYWQARSANPAVVDL